MQLNGIKTIMLQEVKPNNNFKVIEVPGGKIDTSKLVDYFSRQKTGDSTDLGNLFLDKYISTLQNMNKGVQPLRESTINIFRTILDYSVGHTQFDLK